MEHSKKKLGVASKLLLSVLLSTLVITAVVVSVYTSSAANSSKTDIDPKRPDKQTASAYIEKERAENLLKYTTATPVSQEEINRRMAITPDPKMLEEARRGGAKEDGRIDKPSSPFSSRSAVATNAWVVLKNNKFFALYAGELTQQPGQSVVIVQTSTPDDLKDYSLQYFPAPVKEGKLRVIAGDKFKVTLESEKGTRLEFDLASLKFK